LVSVCAPSAVRNRGAACTNVGALEMLSPGDIV
jgi:hypothetical protein